MVVPSLIAFSACFCILSMALLSEFTPLFILKLVEIVIVFTSSSFKYSTENCTPFFRVTVIASSNSIPSFDYGDPVKINDENYSPYEILKKLNKLGNKHGIGRVDIVENRFIGMKSRGIYETPGGTILFHAHRAIESITLDAETAHKKDAVVSKYAELIYNGFWFSEKRKKLQKIVDTWQNDVNGDVKLKLFKGNVIVLGRKSENSLYDLSKVSFENNELSAQKFAEEFIKSQFKKIN